MFKIILFITSLFLLLILRFILFYLYTPKVEPGESLEYSATIFNLQEKYGSQTFISKYSNSFSYLPIKIILPKSKTFFEAEIILLSGNITSKVINGVVNYEISNPKIIKITKPLFIFSVAQMIQKKISDLFYLNLSQKDAGLLLGILLGTKANFDKSFLNDLSNTGVMHVIAASGMNVTIVAGFLFFLSVSSFKRSIAIYITVAGLLFYVFISGFQPSIIRALIMISFSLFGQFLGRQYSPVYGLILAAFIMLFYDPSLVSSVSFQLSFASTLGILLFNPLLPQNKFLGDFTTTFSAQLMSLPIIVTAFGSFGVLTLLVNILVLWTVVPLMVLGGIGAILGLLIEPLAYPFLFLAHFLLWYFEQIVMFFGSLNFKLIINVNIFLLIGYYITILGIWFLLKRIKSEELLH